MKKEMYLIASVLYMLSAFGWFIYGLYSFEPSRMSATIIIAGWFALCMASITLFSDYRKMGKNRPQKF